MKTKEPTTLLPRMSVVEAARKYMGNPHTWGGRNRLGGLDCGGLCIVVVEDLGLEEYNVGFDPPTTKLALNTPHSNPKSMYGIFSGAYQEIPVEDAGVGDIEIYYIRDRNVSCHCAILTDKGFIHTHAGAGRVLEDSRCSFWDIRRKAAFRIVGIEE